MSPPSERLHWWERPYVWITGRAPARIAAARLDRVRHLEAELWSLETRHALGRIETSELQRRIKELLKD